MGQPLYTKQVKWQGLRDTVLHTALDTTLGVTGRKWADRPSRAGEEADAKIKIRKGPWYLNEWVFRFRATASISDVTWKLWKYQETDDAEYIANGTADFGTQTATKTNDGTATLYADKIVISAQRFHAQFDTTHPTGDFNEIAKLHGDAKGGYLPYMELTAVTGTGSVSVDFIGA